MKVQATAISLIVGKVEGDRRRLAGEGDRDREIDRRLLTGGDGDLRRRGEGDRRPRGKGDPRRLSRGGEYDGDLKRKNVAVGRAAGTASVKQMATAVFGSVAMVIDHVEQLAVVTLIWKSTVF